MKKLSTMFSVALLLTGLAVNAQVKIGGTAGAPDASAILDISNITTTTAKKGFLPPQVALTSTTDVATIPSPASSLLVFNTATVSDVVPGYYYYSTALSKWITFSSVQDLREVGTANHITQDAGVGSNGTSVGTGTDNVAIGLNGLSSNTTGVQNIAIGTSALQANTSGRENLAIGWSSLTSNTTGRTNTAYGNSSMYSNTTGTNNTAVGATALYFNTGSFSTALGYAALVNHTSGDFNTALGSQVLSSSSTGSENTGVGDHALTFAGTGSQNTAVGVLSGRNVDAGNRNTAIGYNTGVANSNASNQLNIANNIFGTGLTGTVFAPAGNIGIGTVAPNSTLQVAGSLSVNVVTVTADYTVKDNDYMVLIVAQTSSQIINITLPDPTTCKGRIYKFKCFGANTGVTGSKGQITNSVYANNALISNFPLGQGSSASATFMSDGVNYYSIW